MRESQKLQRDFKDWINPFIGRVRKDCISAGIDQLTISFPGIHFFDRVIERNIDKGVLGSLFVKLLRHHSCQLIYIALTKGLDSRNFVDKPTTILVTYKTLKVVLHVLKYHDRLTIVAATALSKEMKSSCDFYIDITK